MAGQITVQDYMALHDADVCVSSPLTELDVSVPDVHQCGGRSPGKGPNVTLPAALWVDPLPVLALVLQSLHNTSARHVLSAVHS